LQQTIIKTDLAQNFGYSNFFQTKTYQQFVHSKKTSIFAVPKSKRNYQRTKYVICMKRALYMRLNQQTMFIASSPAKSGQAIRQLTKK
jgi:hypothetical protein